MTEPKKEYVVRNEQPAYVPILGKTIFLNSGATFTFKNVTNVVENKTVLTFGYKAMSDNKYKFATATFYTKNIAGHSNFNL